MRGSRGILWGLGVGVLLEVPWVFVARTSFGEQRWEVGVTGFNAAIVLVVGSQSVVVRSSVRTTAFCNKNLSSNKKLNCGRTYWRCIYLKPILLEQMCFKLIV